MDKISLTSAFLTLFKRDLLLVFRSLSDLVNPLLFCFMVISLLPLGIGPSSDTLSTIAPGMIWIVALLSVLLSIGTLFSSDYNDGSLEKLILSPYYLYFLVISKVLAHWLLTGVPLALIAPFLAVLLSLPESGTAALMLSLFIGTAVLSLLGAIGAALTVSLRSGGGLISIIILPLYIPVLIFGASCVQMGVAGESIGDVLSVLGAFLCLALLFAPAAIAGALQLNVKQ